MKSILIHVWVAASFLFAVAAHGQTPGYIGKRLGIRAEGFFFPALGLLNQGESFQINYQFGLDAEYVLSRQVSIGISASQMRQSFFYELQNEAGEADLFGRSIGVHTRIYSFLRRGNIAPMGFYQQINLQFFPYRVEDLSGNFESVGLEEEPGFLDVVILYGIGRQRFINRRLMYHAGITGGWVLNAFDRRATFFEREIKTYAADRLRQVYFFNISLGFGFLID